MMRDFAYNSAYYTQVSMLLLRTASVIPVLQHHPIWEVLQLWLCLSVPPCAYQLLVTEPD